MLAIQMYVDALADALYTILAVHTNAIFWNSKHLLGTEWIIKNMNTQT